ncbi:MAG: diaminopimelate epimerase [Actinomycetota bacterium]|nr:diaminopimelate epimerase [Solirubrobacterales bacterium]MDQ3090811.1 diaminopimelate epimerase [Actinomycetota bacterium]MDQ3372039.1 diaminopimelate epimerase [Actinomycetota bacterium]MDQ3410091.1 diaminopimelate epimerase [Actinomycetota bacterium]
MRLEKWQALGNDYLIAERDALALPLTPARVRRLCDRHVGLGADGVLQLEPPDAPGFTARLRIFNPDGSEAELSGNGAREAILYLRRRGWTEQRTFSIQTVAGELRATIADDLRSARVDMGRARLHSVDFPAGGEDGSGRLPDGTTFQHVSIGNPQCAIHVADQAALDALDLPAIGPAIEHHDAFPNRTNVSWWTALGASTIRARIFERGVGETRSSGTGATGAAVAHVLGGGDSPVTVRLDGGELEVEVGEDFHVDLTGWAVAVYAAQVSDELLADLGTDG